MSRSTYEYGSQCVVVETGMPEDMVRIGIGDDWSEAVESLQSTPIQSAGRTGQAERTALEWAAGQEWIDAIDSLDPVDVDLDAELSPLIAEADTSHEDAEAMYDSLGWHANWSDDDQDGQVAHPVCTVEQLDTLTDRQILEIVAAKASCDDERYAYESAITYARDALNCMRSVESYLDDAVAAYERGDATACVEDLDAASRTERDYGDDPAASSLRRRLLKATS